MMPRKMATRHLTEEQKLIKALSYPLREEIFRMVSERGPISPAGIAREIDQNVTNVSHHMNVLRELGCVEEVETQQRRGATEHFFVATRKPWLDASSLDGLPDDVESSIISKAIQLTIEDWTVALNAETLGRDSNYVLARDRLVFDEQGYTEAREIVDRALEEIIEVEAMSAKRRKDSGEEGTQTSVAFSCFPLP